jgi:UDP-N-acetylmuramoyl-L-alanyl-D-glutamate--2,6-diaminopimelate ligase
LRRAVEDECTAAVLEVSSHALALRRVGAVEFDVGIFTNIGRDHLNFHVDMDDYRRAKSLLFRSLGAGGKRAVALINADDPNAPFMRESNRAEHLAFAIDMPADVQAVDVVPTLKGVSFTAATRRGRQRIELRHLGQYSVANALAAVALGEWLGLDLEEIAAAIVETPPVPGRFELVEEGQDFAVAVDYAHKPDALLRLLESARRLQPRRLITVFGCGGDRDRGKRAVMGRIAAELSDRTVVTSDNPRSEEPQAIIDEIVAGYREIDPELRHCIVEVDRARAIRLAVAEASAGDMVLIAGKGHESYQLIAGERLDFDDRAHARAALRGRRR